MTDSIAIFPPGFRLTDATGVPISGGYFVFYVANTTDLKEVFADVDLATSLGSTVYTDAEGYPVTAHGGSTRTMVYTGVGTYKVAIYDSDDVLVATHDDVPGAVLAGSGGGGGGSGITQAAADVRYVRNPNALTAETAIADDDLIPFWDVSASGNKAILFSDLHEQIIPAGTAMVFRQSAAPTGWTKDTTAALDNAAIRIVTGTGGGTGGSVGFTTVMAERTLTQANLPNVSFTGTSGGAGSHTHDFAMRSQSSGASHTGLPYPPMSDSGSSSGSDGTTRTEPSHTHSLSVSSGGSATPLDFRVKYADFIVATKD